MTYDAKNLPYDEISFYSRCHNKKSILSHRATLRIEIKKLDNLNSYWYGNRPLFDKYLRKY